MAITVHLSGHLKAHSNGELKIELPGEHRSVGDVLSDLWGRHPALRDRVLDDQGQIRQHVNIFYSGADVKKLQGFATRVSDGDVYIFNAVSGG